jgi:hypothetical protein
MARQTKTQKICKEIENLNVNDLDELQLKEYKNRIDRILKHAKATISNECCQNLESFLEEVNTRLDGGPQQDIGQRFSDAFASFSYA